MPDSAGLFDASGHTTSALQRYRLFTDVRQNADVELQSRVEAVRVRISELEGDPGP